MTSDATESGKAEEALEERRGRRVESASEEGGWKEGTKWRLLLKVAAALLCCFSRFATFKMALAVGYIEGESVARVVRRQFLPLQVSTFSKTLSNMF